ncbi:MAG: hypothetical protein NC039_09115 [Muribaculaceae bacterium]|nr:hypothetical protein [Muribaculaceae bacterium]
MLTENIRQFLQQEDSQKDWAQGADLLQRITGNAILYREMMRKGPGKYAPFINKRLTEILEFRLAKLTHTQVSIMKAKADKVVEQSKTAEEKIRSGRRQDHDRLPDEIKAAYAEALDCLNKERELHMQIRRLALHTATCPDSELYPFVKEILKVDDRRLALWQKYDSYEIPNVLRHEAQRQDIRHT